VATLRLSPLFVSACLITGGGQLRATDRQRRVRAYLVNLEEILDLNLWYSLYSTAS
jgi:hypothetical protein